VKAAAVQAASKERSATEPSRGSTNRPLPQPLFAPTLHVQRQCACGGGCQRCQDEDREEGGWAIPSGRIQARLAVGAHGDRYEEEAERVAGEVVTGPGSLVEVPITTGITGVQAGAIASARHPAVSPLSSDGMDVADHDAPDRPGVESRLRVLAGSGNALPGSSRLRLESRFGFDFGAVRIHDDAEAAQLNEALESLAFTHGRDIYFARGAYLPGTAEGDRLLAHELTHVVQQSGGSPGGTVGGPAVVQRYEELKVRGDLLHKEVEARLRDKNRDLVTEAKIPGGTTKEQALDAVGRPDLYEAEPKGVLPGVQGEYAKDDPDKRTLKYGPLRQNKAESAGPIRSSPTILPGGAFSGDFPSIKVGDIKPLAIEKFLAGKLHIGPKIGEGMAQIANYKAGYKDFTDKALKDGKVGRAASAQNLTTLQIPAGLDYRNFATEGGKASPGEGSLVAKSKNARYWIFPVPEWGLYVYFTLPHPFNAPAYRAAVDKVFAELQKFTSTLRQKKTTVDTKLGLKRRPPGWRAGPARRVQRKPAAPPQTDWNALGRQWETQRSAWDRDLAKPFLAKEGSEMGEKVAIDHILGDKGPFKAEAPQQVKEFHSVELWSGVSGQALVKGRTLLGGAFDKIADFYEYVRTKFSGFHQKMQSTNPSGYGWKAKVMKVVVEALKIGFKELLTAVFRIFAACFNGVMDKVIDSFTERIEDSVSDRVKTLHELFDSFRDQVKAEFEARFGSWDKMIEELQTGAKIVGVIMGLVDVIRVIIQILSCLAPPAAGCLWGIVVNLASEVALTLGIPLVVDSRQFREQVVQPAVQDLVKDYAGEEIQGVIDYALGKVHLDEYSKEVKECQIKGAVKPVSMLISPLSGGLTDAEMVARRDKWEAENRQELAAQVAQRFTTPSGATATPGEVLALFDLVARRKPTHEELKVAFGEAYDPLTLKFDLAKARGRLSGAPRGVLAEPPTITQRPPSARPRVEFGPFSPAPGADKERGFGGPSISVPIPLP
jgi:hypothetical protein